MLLEHVDLVDGNGDFVADFVGFLCPAADEAAAGGVEYEEVVGQGGDVHEAGEEKFGELDKEAEVPCVHDDGMEGQTILGGSLELEKLELLEAHRFALGICRGAFGGREVFRDGG